MTLGSASLGDLVGVAFLGRLAGFSPPAPALLLPEAALVVGGVTGAGVVAGRSANSPRGSSPTAPASAGLFNRSTRYRAARPTSSSVGSNSPSPIEMPGETRSEYRDSGVPHTKGSSVRSF